MNRFRTLHQPYARVRTLTPAKAWNSSSTWRDPAFRIDVAKAALIKPAMTCGGF